ncbi:MAG: FAD-dependent monooxygenase [Hyphomicrobiales bacterium]|nr:FAD-dependent monooxygenase [Hyphomicrobiales bacterium]
MERIKTDILVAGAGAAGLIAAIALARAGHRTLLVGRTPPHLPGRTVALFEGSLRTLEDLGLRAALGPISAPVAGIRIIDDTGSVFAPPPAVFAAREIGLENFGLNVANDDIVAAYSKIADNLDGLTRREAFVTDYAFGPDGVVATLDDGAAVACAMVVAGDGRKSKARIAAGIEAEEWTYPQVAITAILRHRRGHDDLTTEFHTRSGPFTFVPMPPLADAPHRTSLVWLVKPEEAKRLLALDAKALADAIAEAAHHRYGAIQIEGDVGSFPMGGMRTKAVSAQRLMLVGEACHVFPPLAAQGLNLGIRDSADAALALDGVDLRDSGALEKATADYETARRADIDMRTRGVDLLNRSLLSQFPAMDALRGAALGVASTVGPLKRAIMREGVEPRLARTLAAFLPEPGGR